MRDIVWLAITSMALAAAAIALGILDVFSKSDLMPLVLGAGLASVTFSLLGMTDRMTGRS